MRNKVYLEWEAIGDRTGHEAGRKLLSRLYRRVAGEEMPEIAVAERGKPYFPGSSWHFSISHTPNMVFCALADCPVGVDAEERDRKFAPALSRKVMSPGECARWAESADQNRSFLRLWVLKEASVKLSGEGLRGYPNHTDFDPEDPRVLEIAGCYVAVLTEEERDVV